MCTLLGGGLDIRQQAFGLRGPWHGHQEMLPFSRQCAGKMWFVHARTG